MTFQTRLTVEEFDKWVLLPENIERNFEYIGGEIVEGVSNGLSSRIAGRIFVQIGKYLEGKPIGEITMADAGYMVAGERYIPDIAFCYTEKISDEPYNPNAPDLAVEVLSPGNTDTEISIKVSNYLHANTVVWVVDPDKERVVIHNPKHPVKIFHIGDTLDGGDVLPGFTLSVNIIFTPLGKA